ncbi:MAG: tetratricopeptide repeat protein [Bacteroidales bacterium]|nr:tetratricopeptide repeat protein [Bacteroidales bacterium]
MMRVKALITMLAAVLALGVPSRAADGDYLQVRREALRLYDSGMYEQAKTLFQSIPDDPTSSSYALLCALKMKSPDALKLLDIYEAQPGGKPLSSQVYFLQGLNLFDEGNYTEAAAWLDKVDTRRLYRDQVPEYTFKRGYCDYDRVSYPEARKRFLALQDMEFTDYTAPSRYALGFMSYADANFDEAISWFAKAQSDPRFAELCRFYILDCEFMRKNYDYVIANFPEVFEASTGERREHLARIISESYLVQGDKEKAREFYDASYREDMTRSDYFYAGSVLYAVEDYPGAIENYSKMPDRSDSLGQIANYHLGNAYIHTRNQVAALTAFRDASVVAFDPEITEDALFNYAKLAFDLNQDTSGFEEYIKRYSTSRKGDQIYGYMALTALVKRDYAAAVEAYDCIDELSPDETSNYMKANFLRGVQLYDAGAYRDAIPCFRAASFYLPHQNPFNQLSRYQLAESYYRTERYSEAADLYSDLYNLSALDGSPMGRMLPLNIAYSHYKLGNYDTAARWFDNYVASGEKTWREDAMTRRADCDFARRDYKAAINSYGALEQAFDSPDNIYPYYMRALAYGLNANKRQKASTLAKVEKASPSAPMYDEAMYELGRSQMEISKPEDAIRAFELLRTNTSDPAYRAKALIGEGMVYRNEHEYDQALDRYKQVVSSMRGSEYAADALQAIESIYQARKQPQKYLEYLEENRINASISEADREALYFSTAEQLFLASSWQQALGSLQKYLDTYPEGSSRAQAVFYMAECYKSLGDKEKACDKYKEAYGMDKSGHFAELSLVNYARLSYDLEHYKDAYEGYAMLLTEARLEDNKPLARQGMMRAAFRSHDYPSAIIAAAAVKSGSKDASLRREADYVTAKSMLATSRRDEALEIFRSLSSEASTPEGAEAWYLIIKDQYERGRFEDVEKSVYAFSSASTAQQYWLACAFLVLGDSFIERHMLDQAQATYESIRDGYQASGPDDDVQDNVKLRLDRLETLKK